MRESDKVTNELSIHDNPVYMRLYFTAAKLKTLCFALEEMKPSWSDLDHDYSKLGLELLLSHLSEEMILIGQDLEKAEK